MEWELSREANEVGKENLERGNVGGWARQAETGEKLEKGGGAEEPSRYSE